MSTSNEEQKSILVPQHKRLAQGADVNGQSYDDKAKSNKPKSGLGHIAKKNK